MRWVTWIWPPQPPDSILKPRPSCIAPEAPLRPRARKLAGLPCFRKGYLAKGTRGRLAHAPEGKRGHSASAAAGRRGLEFPCLEPWDVEKVGI